MWVSLDCADAQADLSLRSTQMSDVYTFNVSAYVKEQLF